MTRHPFTPRRSAAAWIALLTLSAAAPAQVTWTKPDLIPARSHHALEYDVRRGRVVLFGGQSGGQNNETWEWDGSRWTERVPATRPPVRSQHAMAYDAARGRVVLFGGSKITGLTTCSPPLGDTWQWDGTNWQQLSPAVSPPARCSHQMVYDLARRRVVLFGGYDGATRSYFRDTWEWDGTVWVPRAPVASPRPRASHAMAFDAARGRVVVFGGDDGSASYRSDTWEWDGSTWTPRVPTSRPAARIGGSMVYDAARQRVILVGGLGQRSTPLNDTWDWDGTNWRRIRPEVSPRARFSADLAYDQIRGVAVLFGGARIGGTFDDTLEWDGVNWRPRGVGGALRYRGSLVYDSGRQRVMTYLGMFGTWTWNGTLWSQRATANRPPNPGPMADDHTRSRVVLHGINETWEFDGADWGLRERSAGGRGPVTRHHGLVYDEARGQTVLFGGSIGLSGTPADHTWLWDGSSWTQVNPTVKPAPRLIPAMAYDRARGRTLLFSGTTGFSTFGDTWEWDGTRWTQLFPQNTPVARRTKMTYDSARERIVLFGGQNLYGTAAYTDTWEWDGTDWIRRTPTASPPAPTCSFSVLGFYCVDSEIVYDEARAQTVLLWEGERTWLYGPENPAAHTAYGSGCPGTAGTPVLAAAPGELPWTGGSFTTEVTGVPAGGFGVAFIGASRTAWGPLPLPLSLSFLGLPSSCQLLTDPSLSVAAAPVGASIRWTVAIPNQARLRGASYFQQAIVLDAGAPGGMAVTNGGEALIGGK